MAWYVGMRGRGWEKPVQARFSGQLSVSAILEYIFS